MTLKWLSKIFEFFVKVVDIKNYFKSCFLMILTSLKNAIGQPRTVKFTPPGGHALSPRSIVFFFLRRLRFRAPRPGVTFPGVNLIKNFHLP